MEDDAVESNEPDMDLKIRMAANRVLQAVTLRRQARVAVWASTALSVATLAIPDLSPILRDLAGILSINAIYDLLKDVADGKETADEPIAARMEALLPTDAALAQLKTGQKDLLRALTKQQQWLELITNNQQVATTLLQDVIRVTGNIYELRQQLRNVATIDIDQVGNLLIRVLHQMNFRLIRIPIVVAAMSNSQAKSLADKLDVNAEYKIIKNYYAYTGLDVETWVSHYKESPDDWTPFSTATSDSKSIQQLVSDLIADINSSAELQGNTILEPQFLSNEFFVPKSEERKAAIVRLVEEGGILIIDPLSLQHSVVRKAVVDSAALGNKNVSAIVLSPIALSSISIHLQMLGFVETELEVFHGRFFSALDYHSEFGGGDIIYLRRWLFKCISDYKYQKSVRNSSPELWDRLYQPNGIQRNPDGHKVPELFRSYT